MREKEHHFLRRTLLLCSYIVVLIVVSLLFLAFRKQFRQATNNVGATSIKLGFIVTTNEPINCACPYTCDSFALAETPKLSSHSCQNLIEYLMTRHAIPQIEACSMAAQEGACGPECDPDHCSVPNHMKQGGSKKYGSTKSQVAVLTANNSKEHDPTEELVGKEAEKTNEDEYTEIFNKTEKQQKSISLTEKLRLIRQENLNATQHEEKVFGHFLSHIPKTGGFYVMNMLNDLIANNPEWKKLNEHDKFCACIAGLIDTNKFEEKYPKNDKQGIRCALWMSERPHTKAANHVYTIIRNPRSHVLSQYFHCTESTSHKKSAHLMPSLDEWLNTYVDRVVNPDTASSLPKYSCYNPINMQSKFVEFNENTTMQELKERYSVIGDQAHMDKTLCLLFLHFTGFFPPQCDCTHSKRRLKVYDHGVKHHGDTFKLNRTQEEAIDVLTRKDEKLYQMAKQLFQEQVKEVENEFGVKLCDKIRQI